MTGPYPAAASCDRAKAIVSSNKHRYSPVMASEDGQVASRVSTPPGRAALAMITRMESPLFAPAMFAISDRIGF
jgi:hypothetical protein